MVPPVLDFKSARAYLAAVFAQEKRENQATLQSFAAALDLSAPTLKMIMGGERSLTLPVLHRLASVLHLSLTEREHLETLHLLEFAACAQSRAMYRQRLARARGEARKLGKPAAGTRTANGRLMGQWWTPALFVLLLDGGDGHLETEDRLAAAFAAALSLAKADVAKAAAELRAAGLLGNPSRPKTNLNVDRAASTRGQVRYLRELLAECGRRVADDYARPDTLYRAATFTVSEAAWSAQLGRMRAFLDELAADSLHGPADANDQISIAAVQMFPVFGRR